MSIHRLMLPQGTTAREGEQIFLSGDEARHALRVKRLHEGDLVEALDGCGTIVVGAVAPGDRRGLTLEVKEVRRVEPVSPRIEVVAAAPKGGRVDDMVRSLSQVGAAAWVGLRAARSVVEARPAKLERLRTIAAESAKQCGRAWVLEVGETADFEDVVDGAVMADPGGVPYEGTGDARILIGPEGGWSDEELEAGRSRGRVCSFGVHVMRIEVAAAAAAAIVLDQARRR